MKKFDKNSKFFLNKQKKLLKNLKIVENFV